MSYIEYAAFLVAVVWFISVAKLGKLNEWHHALPGFWLFIVGNHFDVFWLALGGLLVAAEDAYAHTRECFQPDYKGPLWRLYRFLYPSLPTWLRL